MSNNVSVKEIEEIKKYREYVYLINITLPKLLNVKEIFIFFFNLYLTLGPKYRTSGSGGSDILSRMNSDIQASQQTPGLADDGPGRPKARPGHSNGGLGFLGKLMDRESRSG